MKRALVAGICIVGTWLVALPAGAGTSDLFDAQYEGRVERDPSTWLGFEVIRRDGARKVGRVAGLLPYNCDHGEAGRAYARVRGKLPVNGEGRFSGKLEGNQFKARGAGDSVVYDLAGRLGAGGRARGTIDSVLRFLVMRHGGDSVRCYTGELSWRARRGANTDPAFSARDERELR